VLQTHLTATISQSKQALFAEQSSSGFRVEEDACSSIYLYLQYLPEYILMVLKLITRSTDGFLSTKCNLNLDRQVVGSEVHSE
jgi:hypothetical protein